MHSQIDAPPLHSPETLPGSPVKKPKEWLSSIKEEEQLKAIAAAKALAELNASDDDA
jgi:hypothetical protein